MRLKGIMASIINIRGNSAFEQLVEATPNSLLGTVILYSRVETAKFLLDVGMLTSADEILDSLVRPPLTFTDPGCRSCYGEGLEDWDNWGISERVVGTAMDQASVGAQRMRRFYLRSLLSITMVEPMDCCHRCRELHLYSPSRVCERPTVHDD